MYISYKNLQGSDDSERADNESEDNSDRADSKISEKSNSNKGWLSMKMSTQANHMKSTI